MEHGQGFKDGLVDPLILNFKQSSKLIIFNQISLIRCKVNLI
jgi:hypothetical protein